MLELYSETLQRFRLAAAGHGTRCPPAELRSRIEDAGLRPIGSTPEEFAAFIERDFIFFEKAILAAKIEPQ